MSEEKQFKIDIPQSLESYKVTLFWGLTIKQIVLVFIAVLFVGFGIFSVLAHHFVATMGMLIVSALALLGIVEIRGRNFYRFVLFIISYYKTKPKVLIYNHYSSSGAASVQARQLVFQKESNTKTFIIIIVAVTIGLLLLLLTGVHLYHVIHK